MLVYVCIGMSLCFVHMCVGVSVSVCMCKKAWLCVPMCGGVERQEAGQSQGLILVSLRLWLHPGPAIQTGGWEGGSQREGSCPDQKWASAQLCSVATEADLVEADLCL